MCQVDRGAVLQLERSGPGAQAHVAVAVDRVGVDLRIDRLAEEQVLGRNLLARGVGSVDIEHKIGAKLVNFVVQFDVQLDADHGSP